MNYVSLAVLTITNDTFIKTSFRKSTQLFIWNAHTLVNKLKSVNYSTHRVLALLAGSTIPILAINIYTLPQLQTQLEALQKYMETQEESL